MLRKDKTLGEGTKDVKYDLIMIGKLILKSLIVLLIANLKRWRKW
jgi:hypothetical protein